jgi:glycosyltransferase involved in cell wall biosynthesis
MIISKRRLCFDVTHTVARIGHNAPTGIDKVDLAYVRHYAENAKAIPTYCKGSIPRISDVNRFREIFEAANKNRWESYDLATDFAYEAVVRRLIGGGSSTEPSFQNPAVASHNGAVQSWWKKRHLVRGGVGYIPAGAIYINVAQHRLEHPELFGWLRQREDVHSIFMIHDLLPLDLPETFTPSEPLLFERRITTALEYGKAFITTTTAVRNRLLDEIERRGVKPPPIHVQPLPSMLADGEGSILSGCFDPDLSAVPYFAVVGTIEPRKNHLLLLQIWRTFAEQGGVIPKLLIVGARGWGCEQVSEILDRSTSLAPHIIEASRLSIPGLARLIANARAVLVPSLDEGYGLPLVEALTLNTPVIATDKPVFHEVTQGCATFISNIDGLGWRDTIREFGSANSPRYVAARRAAKSFRPLTWESYFEGIDNFLLSFDGGESS